MKEEGREAKIPLFLCNIRCLFNEATEWHVKRSRLGVISLQVATEDKTEGDQP